MKSELTKKQNLPGITIVIITLNNERSILKCVNGIRLQNYPKKLIEYLNIDGGSTDKTSAILNKYGFRVVRSIIKKNAEAQRAIGLLSAKNNLIVSLDADNYLTDKNWLKKMVRPFLADSKVVHSGTLHYKYQKNDSLFNRYCSLFGVLDPIVYYIGKPDRISQNLNEWSLGNIIKETKDYWLVEFSKDNLPTVGCNGVVYRKDVLLKYAKSSPSGFLHIDVFADLVSKGFNRFAVVKTDVIHDTAVSLKMLMRKRINFLYSYYLQSKIKRRYLIYNPNKMVDNIKLLLFVVYTVTFIKPFVDSLNGFRKIRDIAWFLHPLICWIYLISYSGALIKKRISPIYDKK